MTRHNRKDFEVMGIEDEVVEEEEKKEEVSAVEMDEDLKKLHVERDAHRKSLQGE